MQWIINMCKKYKELLLYLIFGGLTTLVNIIVYFVMAELMGIHYLVSNAAAWALAVLFAYITNRIFVFESKERGVTAVLREFSLFVGCRVLSGVFDMACMYVCVDLLHINDLIAKIVANVVVVILNYIFSKLIIFRKKKG